MDGMPNGFFCYGVLDGRVIGSEDPTLCGRPRQVVQDLVERQGVRVAITLTEQMDHWQRPDLVQYHVPIIGVPEQHQLVQVVALIAGHLSRGQRVWVHCRRGLDRAGCVLGCLLVSTGMEPTKAIELVASQFPPLWRHAQTAGWWDAYVERIRAFAAENTRRDVR
jgi:protein-tyrosine phosphatase